IYALGVVFYQMLTGELPGQTLEPPSHKVRLDVRLDEVVLRALEKLPERRYQHVSEVKTRVETIAETLGEGKEDKKTQVPPKTQKSAKVLTLLKIIQVLLVDKKTGKLKPKLTILKIILVLLVLHAIVPPIPFLPEIFILGLLGWGGCTLVQRIRRNKKPAQPLEINPSEKEPEGHQTPLSPDEETCRTTKSEGPETDARVPGDEPEPARVGVPSPPADPGTPPRFSILALWGAFAAVRIIWLWVKTLLFGETGQYLIENEPDRINFFWETLRASFVLCASSYEFWVVSLLATVVGWFAVRDIRRSAGRLTGLRLATFGGLAFPLFVLDVAIFYFFFAIGNVSEIRYLWYGGGSFCRGILLLISGCVVLLMAWVDVWVVRRVWRAVKNPVLPLAESIKEEFRRALAPTSSAETRILSLPSVLAIVAVCVAAVTIGYWVKALQGANLFMASVEPETPRTLWKLILFSFHFNTLPPQFSAGVLVTTILG
ncbi:MAG TPA: hypothetical protein PLA90_19105, partial [Candidatus Sumerlaeota bacterium]|nr:hypothetical protein [Candidatus Sumerlaeota bacterium]